eukprot:TRINITY_DN21139_c0_g1_i1.p1 TRINITY_DN21139_c0_g1~~TRINITY_DN21139_c0_g1_i1.p1  ORF type:complete len:271 (+),score=51.57 TRINITY_DN21139_c0_g1_i1:181-993(+)
MNICRESEYLSLHYSRTRWDCWHNRMAARLLAAALCLHVSLASGALTQSHVLRMALQNSELDQHRAIVATSELEAYNNLTHRPSMLEIQTTFFQDMADVHPTLKGLTLRPDAMHRWETLAQSVAPLVDRGVISGFFLGDELIWNNITWDQLNATAAAVKNSFPSCFLWYNEGGAPLYALKNKNHFRVQYPYVPEAVDFVSVDDYNNMTLLKGPVWFYNKFLFRKLLPHQAVCQWVVPPTLNISACPPQLEALDACVRQETVPCCAQRLMD